MKNPYHSVNSWLNELDEISQNFWLIFYFTWLWLSLTKVIIFSRIGLYHYTQWLSRLEEIVKFIQEKNFFLVDQPQKINFSSVVSNLACSMGPLLCPMVVSKPPLTTTHSQPLIVFSHLENTHINLLQTLTPEEGCENNKPWTYHMQRESKKNKNEWISSTQQLDC